MMLAVNAVIVEHDCTFRQNGVTIKIHTPKGGNTIDNYEALVGSLKPHHINGIESCGDAKRTLVGH
jgi:hypothetical protein